MTNTADELHKEKLTDLLSKVQKESENEEFIYGVTDRSERGFFQKINDFFIDKSSVPLKEKGYFFELLATMLNSGIALNQALKILRTKTTNQRLRRVVSTLSHELEHGKQLSQALDRFPEIFDESERGIIKSSEAVGNLANILFKLSKNLNRRSKLLMQIRTALIYPVSVFIALTIGCAIMVVVVVPKIQEIFKENYVELPLATKILLQSSLAVSKGWWIAVLAVIFIYMAFHLYVNSTDGHFSWDFKKLRIPYVGEILRKICVLRFVDNLGLLIESGLPINKTLALSADSIGNEVYRLKIYDALGQVQEGKKLSESLANAPFLFPETVVNMVAVGEQTSSLGEIARKISGHYDREINHTLKNLIALLGPVLTIVIGLLVVFFALAVLSPIFSLTQAI